MTDQIAMKAEVGSSNTWIAFAVVAVQVAITVAVILLVATRGWDDGAITLAYAKTFAATGRIALTPASEQVEGFSTIAWFLLNALVALFQPSFDLAIAISQGLTGLFFCLSAFQIWLLTQDLKLSKLSTFLLLMTYAVLGSSLSEIANGMEMSLLSFTGVGLIRNIYFRRNLLQATVFGSVFLLTRFEAMVYYAFILAPLLYERRYRDFVRLSLLGVGVVGATEVVRFQVFSDLVPNTIHAKLNPPYHNNDGLKSLPNKVLAALEVVKATPLLFMALILILCTRYSRFLDSFHKHSELFSTSLFLASPMIGVIFFNSAIGTNLGYIGRMQTLAFPFAFLLLGFWSEKLGLFHQKSKRFYVLAVSIITVLVSWLVSADAPLRQAYLTLKSRDPLTAFGVTPASYRLTGLAVDHIRELTGKKVISFLTPDVGGLSLCCSRIRVVDLGLLANRTLAQRGYGALDKVISEERPELIEAHHSWASIPRLYNLQAFSAFYEPIIVSNTRMYIRRDVAVELTSRGVARRCNLSEEACLSRALLEHRYAPDETKDDDIEFLKRGYFVDLTMR